MNISSLSDLRKRLDKFETEITNMIGELQDIAKKVSPLRDSVSRAESDLLGLLSGVVPTNKNTPKQTHTQVKRAEGANIIWVQKTLELLKYLKKATYAELLGEYLKRKIISSEDKKAPESIRQSIYTMAKHHPYKVKKRKYGKRVTWVYVGNTDQPQQQEGGENDNTNHFNKTSEEGGVQTGLSISQ